MMEEDDGHDNADASVMIDDQMGQAG